MTLSRDPANGSLEYLKAIGIDLIPVHRWLGFAMLFWASLHGLCEVALVFLSFFALPQFRRKVFPIFIYIHRVATFMFFFGILFHFPTAILWYYMFPSFMLLLIDRFVPRIMMARTIQPLATCTYHAEAEIMSMKLISPEPIKPYFPGDYITVQIPGLGHLHHPFTIASYWPEDPCSITIHMRVSRSAKGKSWTNDLARLCGRSAQNSLQVLVNLNGVFGDKRHDALKSEVLIIFAAGVSIVSFMPLIKAIGAQIASSNSPACIKVQLFCSFRTQSELHAYGSFLHQITHDSRFTCWLQAKIFVSRHTSAQIQEKNATTLGTLASLSPSSLSSSTGPSASSPASSVVNISNDTQVVAAENDISVKVKHYDKDTVTKPNSDAYKEQPLPTHKAVSDGMVIWKMATVNIFILCMLKAWPGAFFFGLRKYNWETMNGSPRYCLTDDSRGIWITFVCQWVYALIPGIVYLVVMFGSCYAGVALARSVQIWESNRKAKKIGYDTELAPKAVVDGKGSVSDAETRTVDNHGHWDPSEVAFSSGRMDVGTLIQTLKKDQSVAQAPKAMSLLVGGPDGFVERVQQEVKAANWDIEFYRETWSL
ncbi:hypothetical protein BGZ83_009490 [Gryganskiella cystojenkinii]|nr:hypothetical protein BGZ83_009490 [Gryganskiella cystojenkinii]